MNILNNFLSSFPSSSRVFTALCRLNDDLAYARVLCYDVMRSLYGFQRAAVELVVAMVTVWPELMPSCSDWTNTELFPFAQTLHYVLTNWTASFSSDLGHVLRTLYCLESDLQVSQEMLKEFASRLLSSLHDQNLSCVRVDEGMNPAFDVSFL